PVRFRLFASAGFRPERAGDLAQVDDDLTELPPLQTVIPGEGVAPVRLRAALTEIGTLEVFCEGAQRWKLEFQLRAEAREAGGVEQSWTLFAQGLTHHGEAAVWAAWWILWRRIAAGLPAEAHLALFEAIAPHLRPAPKQRVANPGKRLPGMAMDEMVRLVG